MRVRVLFFAHLRDLAETDAIDLEVKASTEQHDQLSVRDLLGHMYKQVPQALISALSDESAMVSVNQKYAGWDGAVEDGDEVGILPPVSGG